MNEKTIQSYIYQSLKENSERIALEYGTKMVTYNELGSHSDAIMEALESQAGEQNHIAIMIEDKVEYISCLIAVMKARGVFVPLDSTYVDERIETMLRIADVKYIVTDGANFERLKNIVKNLDDIQILTVEDLNKGIVSAKESRALPEYTPEDSIYIYFTSGSTGVPNAVLGKNKSLLHFIQWEIEAFHFSSVDRMSQFTVNTNDAFLRDLLVPLFSGATLCIPPSKKSFLDHANIISWIEASKLSVIHCTPSLFRVINGEQLDDTYFKSLKYVFMVGERIPINLLGKWFQLFGNEIHIINLYGATETSLAKMYYKIQPEDVKKENIPVGKPIAGVKAIILSPNMQVCKPNEIGEIYIRTPYLTHGYYHNDTLTKAKFIQNPFNNQEGDIIYKTGDIGKFLKNGNIELIGRSDRQIKIRGNRIELDEIEAIISKMEGVKICAVNFFEDEAQIEGNIVAYVKAEQKLSAKEFYKLLEQKMDRNIIPRYIVQVENIPLTSSGKIDYKQLKMPQKKETPHTAVAPRNDIEKKLGEIWKKVIGIQVIDIKENFFKAGGHSLMVMTYINRIYEEYGIEVPLDVVFEKKTIKEMAQYIKDNGVNTSEQSIYQIHPVNPCMCYEISTAQKRIYVLNQLDESRISYNQPSIWKVTGKLDQNRLKDALVQLVKRHEIFRSSFSSQDGEIRQKVNQEFKIDLEFAACRKEGVKEEYRKFIKPFDLGKAPLFRIKILKVEEDSHIMLSDIHHIISDGSTISLLMKEFGKLYDGELLEPVALHYKDYSAWSNQFIQSDYLKDQKAFWLNEFKTEISIIDLPLDYARPPIIDDAGKSLKVRLDRGLTAETKKMGEKKHTTLFMFLLAIFNIVLHKYSGSEDITVGTPVSGRTNPNVFSMAGLFVNTLAIRSVVNPALTFNDFLQEVRKHVISILQNQDFPFEQLVNKLDIPRDLSRNPLFDVMFALHNMDKQEIKTSSLKFDMMDVENCIAKFDLSLAITEKDDEIELNFEYRTKIFKDETIQRLSDSFVKVLEDVIQKPDINISDIDVLSEQEKAVILHKFNHNGKRLQYTKNIIELFEEQVEKTPEAIALVYHEEELSYGDVYAQVNQLSACIVNKLGEIHNQPVGILMERSVHMVVSMLGILKAGCAYVPIDPELPVQRIKVLLEEGIISLILCSSKQVSVCQQLVDCGKLKSYIEMEKIGKIEDTYRKNPSVEIKKDDAAYILYTSGSTGVPKGVVIKHESLSALVASIAEKIDFTKADTILALTTISFDIFVFESLVPLTQGLKVVIADEATQLDNKLLIKLIEKEKIKILQMTPSRMELMLTEPNGLEGIKNVKVIMLGGEVFSDSLAKKLNQLSDTKVFNGYGPTEDTVYSTIKEVSGNKKVNIGRPLAKTNVYILDKSIKCVPIGVKGELCISGAGVAKGYLNKSSLTEERFIPNPFCPGETIYRTGDIARWLENGELEYFGRNDDQIKIRGFRIELGDIQSAIQKIDCISKVVVDVKEKKGNKFLCAYYVSDHEIDDQQIREIIKDTLPSYMIPAYFIKLDEIPLNSNGKVNRALLPELIRMLERREAVEENRNEIEERLIAIWKKLTGYENLSIQDSFFHVGGDSYKVIQMQNIIEKEFQVEIHVADIFSNYTVQQLAKLIQKKSKGEKTLCLQGVNFPEGYYSNAEVNQECTTLHYTMKGEEYDKFISYIEDSKYQACDVCQAMYAYTLFKLCDRNNVSLYAADEKGLIFPLDLNMNEFDSVDALIERIVKDKDDETSEYTYEQLIKDFEQTSTCHLVTVNSEFLDLSQMFDIQLYCAQVKNKFEISLKYIALADDKIQTLFRTFINVLFQLF